jgi:DNA-binding MarR family transcriptional regulator
MNPTVHLVTQWGAFEESHPGAGIEDFCRHYLASRKKIIEGRMVGGVVPALADGLLLKLIGRIQKLHMGYAGMALEGTGLNQIEEFGMLVTIQQEKNPRKSDIVYANLFELSSGTDMLNRLKKRGLIRELPDKEDRRSKRIELTPTGTKAIERGRVQIGKVARIMTVDLTEDDKQLCIQLLKNIEIKFSALWPEHKGLPFEEAFADVMKDSLKK